MEYDMQSVVVTSLSSQAAEHITRLCDQVKIDQQFAKWLVEEYKPIAGGWQY
jgi:hypothetical protein